MRSKSLGHQYLETLAQQLISRVAKQRLDLRIHQNNGPHLVHHQHTGGCCLKRQPKLLGCPFSVAHIKSDAKYFRSDSLAVSRYTKRASQMPNVTAWMNDPKLAFNAPRSTARLCHGLFALFAIIGMQAVCP